MNDSNLEKFEYEINVLKVTIEMINKRIDLYKRCCRTILINLFIVLCTLIRVFLS